MDSSKKGPDDLYPATSYTSTKLNEPVKLRLETNDKTPISIFTKFKKTVDQLPHKIALAHEVNGKWEHINYESYWNFCLKAAKSFIHLGLKTDASVAIIGFNTPPWMISLYGAIFAGGIGCGIYTTNSVETCSYILDDCGASIVVVENKLQLDKILQCKHKSKIDVIIQYSGDVTDSHNGLVKSWHEFMNYSENVSNKDLNDRIRTIAPNKCCTLIYTSGTTGQPKAVMISHDNITYNSQFIIEQANLSQNDRLISYLPLSHIAAQMIDCFIVSFLGATLYYARPDALKGTLVQTIIYAKPTIFLGVPRTWEKIEETIRSKVSKMSNTKQRLFNWATKNGLIYTNARFTGQTQNRFKYWIADTLVLKKIRQQLGFDQARQIYSAAAPINRKTLEFIIGLGLPITEVYGMSESTGPHSFGKAWYNKIASCGSTIHSFNSTRFEEKNRELCMFGRHVFMGYLNSPSKTAEAIDANGWLHSGDIGKTDKDGFLYITGRIKELIITAGGENIQPVQIEDNIINEFQQCISNCMVIGDNRKYLICLITLKTQIDPKTLEPSDELADSCKKYIQNLGLNLSTVSEVLKNKSYHVTLYRELTNVIKRANLKAISNAAKVQKFIILPRDFSLPGGELTPTLKLKRQVVCEKYKDLIEDAYSENAYQNPAFSE